MTRMLTVALVTLGDPGQVTGGYLYHRRMAEMAGTHGTGIEFLSFPTWPFPLAAAAGPAVLRACHRLCADAIVIDSIVAAFVGPWIALRRPNRPLLAMVHQPPGGIDSGPGRTAVQALLDRLAYVRVDRLLVASASLADELSRCGTPRERMRVVPPGRDLLPAGESPGDLRLGRRAAFVCVGNWIERKGIHSLLQAFALLPQDTGTLHLIGDDGVDVRYSRHIRALLARPELAGRAVVHGVLPRERVAAYYRAADVFVLPSIREPYGTVYGEAMAAGLCVVGWRAGNLAHLADDGSEGILVPTGDIEALSRALERLALDCPLRRRLSEAAARRAATFPTWEESASLFFGAIRSLADKE